jgi:hypothetical protein
VGWCPTTSAPPPPPPPRLKKFLLRHCRQYYVEFCILIAVNLLLNDYKSVIVSQMNGMKKKRTKPNQSN